MTSKFEKQFKTQYLNKQELKKINGGDGGLWYAIWKAVGKAYGEAIVDCKVNEMPDFDSSVLGQYGAPY